MEPQLNTRTFAAFNTVNTVSAYCTDADLDAAERACAHFEQLFSHTLPDSGLSRVNRAQGKPVKVAPELAELLAASLDYCAQTAGLFDITLGPVVALWDFARSVVPEADALEGALAHVDWRGVHVHGSEVSLDDLCASIALGGVAKGYIADALVALLKERGAAGGMVNLGGNVAVFGGKHDGSPWNVGLRAPRPSAQATEQAFAAVAIVEGSVVTSGIYERCFTAEDGTFYHHILDPATGMPAQSDLASVSLVSERSLDGDGYTTALVIMGLDRAAAFVEAHDGCEAVFVTRAGNVHATSGIGTTIPFRLLDA